jgi:transcriptional antiterminator NusG
LEDVVELKNGVQKVSQKKMFPGYVLIHMVMNDDTWYVVRNTRGVTGFVGPGSKPVPLSEEEMAGLGFTVPDVVVGFELGDTVVVTAGAWKDTVGAIKSINEGKKTITINVEMFGRETPVELAFTEVKKM